MTFLLKKKAHSLARTHITAEAADSHPERNDAGKMKQIAIAKQITGSKLRKRMRMRRVFKIGFRP